MFHNKFTCLIISIINIHFNKNNVWRYSLKSERNNIMEGRKGFRGERGEMTSSKEIVVKTNTV